MKLYEVLRMLVNFWLMNLINHLDEIENELFETRSETQRGRKKKMKNLSYPSKHGNKTEWTPISFTSSQLVCIFVIYGDWICARNSLSTFFLKMFIVRIVYIVWKRKTGQVFCAHRHEEMLIRPCDNTRTDTDIL